VASEADEARLARRASAGDGAAFATLYDRYERRVFNLCLRITASDADAADATQESFLKVLERLPQLTEREFSFGSYLFTVARNASYDAIARRRRTAPAEIAESAVPVGASDADAVLPENRALRTDQQQQIRAANESLPPRQREALALRELEELSYDEIAEQLGMNRNSVAQLISRARIGLRDSLEGTALASIAVASDRCERALPLIALRHDHALEDSVDAAWLAEHLGGCATCRARAEAVEEAGLAYRLWLPVAPALALRRETIAHAAELVGADWSEFAGRDPGGGAEDREGDDVSGRGSPDGASEGEDAGNDDGGGSRRSSTVRRTATIAAASVLLLLAAGLALPASVDSPQSTGAAPAPAVEGDRESSPPATGERPAPPTDEARDDAGETSREAPAEEPSPEQRPREPAATPEPRPREPAPAPRPEREPTATPGPERVPTRVPTPRDPTPTAQPGLRDSIGTDTPPPVP
jgi:RNA polymerase sigma factor (sigma-70 family)